MKLKNGQINELEENVKIVR